MIPWCTYTDPEVAHVGLYEHEAKERGLELRTSTIALGEVDRAVLDGQHDGFLKVYVKRERDKILGATLVARHAGEMVSAITLAMTAKVGLGAISRTIHCYPSIPAPSAAQWLDLERGKTGFDRRLMRSISRKASAISTWRYMAGPRSCACLFQRGR